MRPVLARLGTLLVCVTGFGAFGAAPAAAAPGFNLDVTELPGQFRAGAAPERISVVVATTNNDGCRKVLWSMLLRVDGLRLDQIRVDRIEQNGSFPVRVAAQGNTARITDAQLDPGTLCRGRTVTAQYAVAVNGDVTDGRITLTPQAFDANQRQLAQTSVSRDVVSDRSRRDPADRAERQPVEQTEPPVVAETEDPVESADEITEEPATGGGQAAGGQTGAARADTDATAATGGGGTGLVTIGFVIGGLLLFLGVGLLLRLRQRMAGDDEEPILAGGAGRFAARTVPRGGVPWGLLPNRRRRTPPTRYYG